ncbi:TolC family protein [Pedobacter sp. Leaf132]|uniref:TolC family protein n=1 Tax=Pedobacter sp. Leaf132 TaxID=2876557 RepID=UPI001E3122D8|nr:TolC family protein [Pedobacter sp. Leaf132]
MKTLKKITLGLLVFFSVNAAAQETIIPEIKYSDLEKYIELAKQNFPRKKIYDEQRESAKTAVPVAALSFLDPFSGSYFYRPQGRAVLDPLNPYNVNGFQFGINVNLGAYLQKPFILKKAKADAKIADLQAQEYNLAIGVEVKKRYYDYIQAISLVKLTTQMAQENKGVAESLRNRFEKSEITLDAYNQSRINQFNSYQGKIQAESTFLKAKDSLEEIIGVKLTDVK